MGRRKLKLHILFAVISTFGLAQSTFGQTLDTARFCPTHARSCLKELQIAIDDRKMGLESFARMREKLANFPIWDKWGDFPCPDDEPSMEETLEKWARLYQKGIDIKVLCEAHNTFCAGGGLVDENDQLLNLKGCYFYQLDQDAKKKKKRMETRWNSLRSTEKTYWGEAHACDDTCVKLPPHQASESEIHEE